MMRSLDEQHGQRERRPGWDAFLLLLLVFAHLQIWGFAESTLPYRLQDVLRHPVLGRLISDAGAAAMGEIGPRPGEPVGLMLNALVLALAILYMAADLALPQRWLYRTKWLLLILILAATLAAPTGQLILLRQGSGPASYSHDGGVIQTEATIQFVLQGKNPYVEDYTETPMAEWGFSEYRTALYHYPYLPWTFLFSAPFYLLGNAAGLYDQRMVYLLLMGLGLIAAARMVADPQRRLALVMILALNPVMAIDLIFGQNDSFVLCWILFSLYFWQRWQRVPPENAPPNSRRRLLYAATICFGLACASKPTAWFFAPFFGLLLIQPEWRAQPPMTWRTLWRHVPLILRRAGPALVIFGLIVAPYVLWSPYAFYDDVWRWSSGQGETGYQIWGWGGSNFVLALGLVADRFAYWPFWISEAVVSIPLLWWLLHRQRQCNSLANACWHYALFLLCFFYSSRFLNENYLGYILAFGALGMLLPERRSGGVEE
ncbi:MAG: glycosyltransferase family 87 protein [Caldilineaceae bacterium]